MLLTEFTESDFLAFPETERFLDGLPLVGYTKLDGVDAVVLLGREGLSVMSIVTTDDEWDGSDDIHYFMPATGNIARVIALMGADVPSVLLERLGMKVTG